MRALGQALAGTHDAELSWQAASGNAPTTAILQERLSITVSYEDVAGSDDCLDGPLTIPVAVSLSSEASGISESGPGFLTFTSVARPFHAELDYSSARLGLAATLVEVAEQVPPVGELDARQQDLPAESAEIGGGP